MTQFSSSPHHQSLATLAVPDIDISFTGHDIRLVVEHCDIHHSSVRLDSTRLYIAVLLNKEEIGFSDQRLEHLSNGGLFTQEEQTLINQVVQELLGRPLATHDFTEERLRPYIAAGVEKGMAEAHLLMLTRSYAGWQESDRKISNQVSAHFETDKEQQRQKARADAFRTVAEEVEALNGSPTLVQQHSSLLRIAIACVCSNGTFPDFPLTLDDMHFISNEQNNRLAEEQIESVRAWLIAQGEKIPEALPLLVSEPDQNSEDFDDLVWEFDNEDLGMLDTEYAALLAEGINPMTEARLWDAENVKGKLSVLIAKLCSQGIEEGAKKFTQLLQDTALCIAEEVELIPPDRIEEISSGSDKPMTEFEFTRVDRWIETHFGSKLSQFPKLIQLGIHPITLEML